MYVKATAIIIHIILLFVIVACGKTNIKMQHIPEIHTLDIRDYDGNSNSSKARYILDTDDMGAGPDGYNNLLERIALMPSGSQIKMLPYWEGDDGGKYPFDIDIFNKYCNKYNVYLLMPTCE